jgi:hypothetical protein
MKHLNACRHTPCTENHIHAETRIDAQTQMKDAAHRATTNQFRFLFLPASCIRYPASAIQLSDLSPLRTKRAEK